MPVLWVFAGAVRGVLWGVHRAERGADWYRLWALTQQEAQTGLWAASVARAAVLVVPGAARIDRVQVCLVA